MTTREAAHWFGVSIRTIRRRIHKGILSAKKVNRRWVVDVEPNPVRWPFYVHKSYAIADGLKPEDFDFYRWPITNVDILASLHKWTIVYTCEMPNDTPVDNQYIQAKDRKPGIEYESAQGGYLKIPDPKGLCLASVEFLLKDIKNDKVLHEQSALKTFDNKVIQAGPTDHRCELWKVLQPGKSINVQLSAYPKFYFLGEDGGMKGHYALMGLQGYFGGSHAVSAIYNLYMDQDGVIKAVKT